MAEATPSLLERLTPKQRIAGGVAVAAIAAAIAVGAIYGGSKDYRVLFANVADKDGGLIVAQLEQMQVPYKFGAGGSVIMVPEDRVHDVRMKLAGQGLPKGGNVGFELMESQKFGISNFGEQVNYQRALQGELERTISSIDSVAGARVHLTIPKPSVFLRDTLKPSASVVVNLRSGRSLDRAQVTGIANLVSAAVPDLKASAITILDQNGTPLHGGEEVEGMVADARQLTYQRKIERDYASEIEAMLEPIVGRGNVRAKVRADIDFSKIEQTEELFGPNGEPTKAAMRSQQLNESNTPVPQVPGGVPGATSNTPPGAAVAPDQLLPGPDGKPALPPLPPSLAAGSQTTKSQTTNYEVDRTVRQTKRAPGGVARVTVAVLLNHRTSVDDKGVATKAPLKPEELERATKLVKEVVGFKEQRGDSVDVANLEFTPDKSLDVPAVPMWKDPDVLRMAGSVGEWLLFAIGLLFLIFGVARPAMRAFLGKDQQAEKPAAAEAAPGGEAEAGASAQISEQALQMAAEPASGFEASRTQAAQLVAQSPDAAAEVVKNWTSGEAA